MLNEIFSHLHPIVVHFPIVMITIALLYDLVNAIWKRSLSPKSGLWLWLIAAVSSWVAVATGPEDDARGNTTYMDIHSILADVTAWVVTILVIFRLWMIWKENRPLIKGLLVVYLLVAMASCTLVLATGFYGGKMVYSDGVGVKVNNVDVNPSKGFHRNKN
ncbi:MAG: DUF2231 domain-containing protein [Paenibacillaceae bacterium]